MILKDAREGGAWNGTRTMAIVSQWLPDARHDQLLHRGGPQYRREWLPAGDARLPSAGRLDHERKNEQYVAESERVEAALTRFETVSVPLEPGDAILFHANLLHRSNANKSDEGGGISSVRITA